jgi:hypothetical protein
VRVRANGAAKAGIAVVAEAYSTSSAQANELKTELGVE